MQDPSAPPIPAEPELQCDLVMKGGITSGVVYPRAMARVARDYRIRSIGGTSVGAIAAVLTAAAEYWRQANPGDAAVTDQQTRIDTLVTALDTTVDGVNGWDARDRPEIRAADEALLRDGVDAPGFAGLYALPEDIGSDLAGKFQPERTTAGAFRYLIALLDAQHPVTRITTALARQFHWWRIGAAIVVGLLTLAFVLDPRPALWTLVVLAIAALAFVGWRRVRVLWPPTTPEPSVKPAPPSGNQLPVNPVWIGIGGAALLWVLYLQHAIGWWDIVAWIGEHIRLVIGALALATIISQADVIRAWILSRWTTLDPDSRLRRQHLLELLMLGAGIVLAVLLVLFNWNALADHLARTAAVVTGVVVGWVLGGVLGLGLNLAVFIPRNMGGISTGMGNANALTPWLTRRINTVAGLDPDGRPLTFGLLTGLPPDRKISLEAIATDLTRGVPLDLPTALHRYRFRPADFQRLFPKEVLTQLGVTAPNSTEPQPFPPAADIPLVVVARMSMSFPVLFSAVPVYFDDGTSRDLRRCLLSDGGIVSNFPVHKFDRSLPGWPTFAIDLIDEEDGPPPLLSQQIWTNPIRLTSDPEVAEGIATRRATEAISSLPHDNLPGLFTRLVNTARGWMDNSQKSLPGYRERIVGIRLYPGEGGLNLTMSATTIDTLAHRGMYGVHTLLRSWEPEPMPRSAAETDADRRARSQWHQHRWLRYRIIMRSLENIGQEWQQRYATLPANPGPPAIATLVAEAASGENGSPPGLAYAWQFGVHGQQAAEMTKAFDQFAARTPTVFDPQGQPVPGVFDQPVAPEVEPKSLMMPPFE